MEYARHAAERCSATAGGQCSNQSANLDNPRIHLREPSARRSGTTRKAASPLRQRDGTTGTITGTSQYLKEMNRRCIVGAAARAGRIPASASGPRPTCRVHELRRRRDDPSARPMPRLRPAPGTREEPVRWHLDRWRLLARAAVSARAENATIVHRLRPATATLHRRLPGLNAPRQHSTVHYGALCTMNGMPGTALPTIKAATLAPGRRHRQSTEKNSSQLPEPPFPRGTHPREARSSFMLGITRIRCSRTTEVHLQTAQNLNMTWRSAPPSGSFRRRPASRCHIEGGLSRAKNSINA